MDPTPDAVAPLLREFGFAVVVAMILLFFIWRAARWMGERILEPVAKAHIGLLDSVRETNATMSHTQKQQAETLDKIADGQVAQNVILQHLQDRGRVQ